MNKIKVAIGWCISFTIVLSIFTIKWLYISAVPPNNIPCVKEKSIVTLQNKNTTPILVGLCTPTAQDYIIKKYNEVANTPSDIHEHIPIIYKYARMFKDVTELGVRNVVSSWAFAKAGMDRNAEGETSTYRANDITKQEAVEHLDRTLSQCPSILYSFIEGDDLKIVPWQTDVLLIDTWHSFRQLDAELRRWGPYVNNFILLHDTVSFRDIDEDLVGHGGKPIEEHLFTRSTASRGLWQAVESFVTSPRSEWAIHEERKNNNGFTILRRIENALDRKLNTNDKIKTEVVMFIPSPVQWKERRDAVYTQFAREGWKLDQVALIFIIGSRAGENLKDTVDISSLVQYPSALNVIVHCRDYGDEFDNSDDTSGTTCKVYEALKYIAANYEAKYVWRGADDSYVNMRYFFAKVMPTIPTTRLFLGRLRRTDTLQADLMLSRQPNLQKLLGIYQFGQYMHGMGFVFSYDVVDFIASLKIPPHLTWCEDVMVGMWLLPFQITFMNYSGFHEPWEFGPVELGNEYLLIHRMTPEQWQRMDKNGVLH